MADGETFNPQRHITKVGPADYLPVMWRLVWFREDSPDGWIVTELIEHKAGEYAVFKASISKSAEGGSATGYGSETKQDFRDYLEKAETKAIGRALAALGFGTQFSAHEFGGEADNGRIVDSPVDLTRVQRDLPARTRTTSENTVPVAGPGAITPAQMGMIRGLAEEKGIPPEKVREMHGKESAKLLTKQEASELIDRLQGRLEAMPVAFPDPDRFTS